MEQRRDGTSRIDEAGVSPLKVVLVSTYELGRQPFSVASAAAWLKAAGAAVETIDLAVESVDLEKAAGAHLIAISVPMHTATRLALHHLPALRAASPSAVVCCYGLYAAMNEQYLRSQGVDLLLAGEYEDGLTQIARSIDAQRRGIPAQPPLPPIVSLARQDFLVPDREGLAPLSSYARLITAEGERLVGSTEASRGCKHLCRHCPVVPVYGGKFRVVQRDVVLADIRQQVQAGATHITFGDPDFFNGPAHSMSIVRTMHEEFPHVTYDATIKIEHLIKHDNLITSLKNTGCLFVTSAVEAFDDPTLLALQKNHTKQDVVRVAERFGDVGLHLIPTFVAFTPWTTLESYLGMLSSIDELALIESVAPVQYAIRLLLPQGSLLLELPFVQACIKPFDPASLAFPWVHPVRGVDALFQSVLDAVELALAKGMDRSEVFRSVWSIAAAMAGEPDRQPSDTGRTVSGRRVIIPHLSEQWYCCAEPTEAQLTAHGTAL